MNIKMLLSKYKYFKALIVLGIIIIGFFIWVSSKRVSVVTPPKLRDITQEKTFLEVSKMFPESHSTFPKDTHIIKITFDRPLESSSLVYTVQPNISLEMMVFTQDLYTLEIFPNKKMWDENTEYTITIKELRSIDNTSLEKPIIYVYNYISPEYVGGGEAWMEEMDLESKREYLQFHHDYWKLYGENPDPNYEEIYGVPPQ